MTDTATTDTDDTRKNLKELPVVQDQGFFEHDTGDIYDGFFEAKKKDRSVKMDGYGTYTTAEGDSYTGKWYGDKLGGNEDVVISFVDGSKYEGTLKDFSYTGKGKYYYPDGSMLQSEFVDNCPVGNLSLIDPNGHTWQGKADLGFCWLEPVNHFYECLETTRDNHNRVRQRKAPTARSMLKMSKLSKASKTSQLSRTSKMSRSRMK